MIKYPIDVYLQLPDINTTDQSACAIIDHQYVCVETFYRINCMNPEGYKAIWINELEYLDLQQKTVYSNV